VPSAERPGESGRPDHARERRDEFLRERVPQDVPVKPPDAPTDAPDEKNGPDEATPPATEGSPRDDT